MDNTLMVVIGMFLAAILIFVMPLMTVSERNDDIAQTVVQTATAEFVDKISISGVIKPSEYEEYEQTLSSTGNVYEIEIEVQHLDENIGKKNGTTSRDLIGENERYSTFTTEILSNMYEGTNTSKNYVLKKGDNVIVTAKNTSKTMAQTLRSFIYKITGQDAYQLVASSSSMVINDGPEGEFIYISTNTEIERWEQREDNKTIIDGKTGDGTILVTVQIGDYINYDCTNGGNTYSYTSPASQNGYQNQTFTTINDIKWRVIGVEENRLILISSKAIKDFALGTGNYDLFNTCAILELNEISKIFGNGEKAFKARSATATDVKNLMNSYGKGSSKLDNYTEAVYGAGSSLIAINLTTDLTSENENMITGCDYVLIDLLFPQDQDPLIWGMWLASKYKYGNDYVGLHAAGNSEKLLYYANLATWNNNIYRECGVRPVVELVTNVKLQRIGTYNGCSEWNIVR